jgi:hypothetical protein
MVIENREVKMASRLTVLFALLGLWLAVGAPVRAEAGAALFLPDGSNLVDQVGLGIDGACTEGTALEPLAVGLLVVTGSWLSRRKRAA